jgi:hypothetical protein
MVAIAGHAMQVIGVIGALVTPDEQREEDFEEKYDE